jgi:hypothetical protein
MNGSTGFQAFKIAAFALLFQAFCLAQTTQGLISGRILDTQSGRAIADATIRCTIAGGGSAVVGHSGAAGYFVLPLLSPGPYRLRVEAQKYQAAEVHQLEVPVAGRLDLQFRLRPESDVWQAGQYRSVFLPNSEALLTFYGPDVDTSRTASFATPHANRGALEASISQVIDPIQVSDFPLAGRDIYTTLILQPGVSAGTANARGLGLAVSGQRPTASNFLLDGAENNNYLVSGPLNSVAPESVQEYRISTNNFSAEYGRTVGVLANAVTRAGGSGWHGLGYFYARNSVVNANDLQRNLAGISRPTLHEAEPGFEVGGPILRNRLFASASVEYLGSHGYGDPVTIYLPSTGFYNFLSSLSTQFTPGVAYTRQLLAAHPGPVPDSPALSAPIDVALPNFVNRWLALERLDYNLPGGKHRISWRSNQSRLERPDFIWSPYQGFNAPLNDNTFGVVGSVTSAFSPTVTNEARASFTTDELAWDRPHPEIATLASSDQTLLPGSLAFYSYRNRSRTAEISDGVVWSRGRHLLQFGGGLLLRGIDGALTAGRDGRYTFDTILQFATGSPSSYSAVLDRASLPTTYQQPAYDRTYRYTQFQFYAQDTLRATRRLTVNYGVRYENFGAPTNTGSVKDALFVPGSGPTLSARIAGGTLVTPSGDEQIYGSDNRGWAARLGGSYDLTGKGTFLVRGAYGIFYDRPFDNLWANTRLNNTALANFDILADNVNYLAPPQLSTYLLQRGNTGFPNITWVDSGLRNAYVQSFFLGLQKEVSSALTVEVNGTGTLGRKLLTTDTFNRGFADNPNLPTIFYRANQGDSDYAGLQMLARYRARAVQFQAAYTWSHSIDNQSTPLAGDFFDLAFVRLTSGSAYEAPAAFTIQGDSRGDRGSSDFDQRHNLVLSAIVNLPQPRGAGWWKWIGRDWRVATIQSYRSGFPYTVYSGNQISGIANRRANLANPAAIFLDTNVPGGEQLLNRDAFGEPATGNGNLGRNALGGPGLFNVDVSLDRAIPFHWPGEAGRLHFRADAFNFLNHANLGNPDPLLGDFGPSGFGFAQFGRKAAPTGFPGLLPLNETARQIQLMLRLEW